MSAQQVHDYGHTPEKGPLSPPDQELAKVIPIREGIGGVALGSEIVTHDGRYLARRTPIMSAAPHTHDYATRARNLYNTSQPFEGH